MYPRQIFDNFDQIFNFGFLSGPASIFDSSCACYFCHFIATQVQKGFNQIAINESLKEKVLLDDIKVKRFRKGPLF